MLSSLIMWSVCSNPAISAKHNCHHVTSMFSGELGIWTVFINVYKLTDIPFWPPISHEVQCNVLWMWGGMNIYIFGIFLPYMLPQQEHKLRSLVYHHYEQCCIMGGQWSKSTKYRSNKYSCAATYMYNDTKGIDEGQEEKWTYFISLSCSGGEKSGTGHQTHGFYVPEALDSSEIGGKIADSPSLRASLSCLFTWKVLTLGCSHSLIMNTTLSRPRGGVAWIGSRFN